MKDNALSRSLRLLSLQQEMLVDGSAHPVSLCSHRSETHEAGAACRFSVWLDLHLTRQQQQDVSSGGSGMKHGGVRDEGILINNLT